MKIPAGVLAIALAVGVVTLAPSGGAQAQGARAEGPIEIEKCQTISQPGSYKLVNNLVSPGGNSANCVVITAGFVTIDLAGFNISAASLTNGNGIVASGGASIAVRNGSISTGNFGGGVDLSAASGSIVEGLRVSGATQLNGVAITANGIVRGNTVVDFRGAGISATGTVTGNDVDHTLLGVTIGEGSTVIGNTVSNSLHQGLVVSCPSNVIDNTVTNGNIVLNGEGCNNVNNVGS